MFRFDSDVKENTIGGSLTIFRDFMYKLSFYVPEDSLESVKTALFDAGAGCVGNYGDCCWQVLGQGQFRPLAGSHAVIGELDQLTQLAEWRVEMICEDRLIKSAVDVLKQAHPYEEVAYDVLKMVDTTDF